MANPAADYPTAIHTDTDVSLFASQKLGQTAPTHTNLEGKQEEEIKAIETALGTGLGTPTVGKLITGDTTAGTSKWGDINDVVPSQTGNNGYVLGTNGVVVAWVAPGGGGGGGNTASNIGTAGVAIYDSTSGTNFNFRSVESSNGKLGVSYNATDSSADFTVNEANLAIQSMGGTSLPVTKGGTGSTTAAGARGNLSLDQLTNSPQVILQPSTPGTAQTGHSNVTGTAKSGAVSTATLTATGTTTLNTTYNGVLKTTAGVVAASAVTDDLPEGVGNLYYTDARVRANRIDQLGSPITDLNINSNKLTNVIDPLSAQDAATKNYVDAVAQGLSPKPSAVCATTTVLPAYTYSSGVMTATATGTLTIDGYLVALGDYVLVKNETSQQYNGLYYCTTAGAVGVAYVLTRAPEMNATNEFSGSFVFVETGTTNASAGFVCTNTGLVTIGTTNISFTQFSGAGEITTTSEITKTGNQLSITPSGITNSMLAGSIAAAKLIGTDIATVGTVTGGTWNATPVTPVYGGTGLSSATKGDLIVGNGTNTFGKLPVSATNGQAIVADSTQATGLNYLTIPKSTIDAKVSATGGDYTSLSAAIAAGAKTIEVVGTLAADTGLTNVTVAGLTIFGKSRSTCVIVLPNDNTKIAKFNADYLTLSGVTFQGGNVNLANSTDAWVQFGGNYHSIDNCGFEGQGITTTTQGATVSMGKAGMYNWQNSRFTNNRIFNCNKGNYYVYLENYIYSDVIANNKWDFTNQTLTNSCLYLNAGDLRHVSIANNYFDVSGNSSGSGYNSIINVQDSSSQSPIGLYIMGNNAYSYNTPSGGNFIEVYTGTSNTGIGTGVSIVDNKYETDTLIAGGQTMGTQYLSDIKLTGCYGSTIVGNSCGTIDLCSAMQDITVTGNSCAIIDASSNAITGAVITGNNIVGGSHDTVLNNVSYSVISNNVIRSENMSLSSASHCEISNNVSYTSSYSMTVGGSYNTIYGNSGATLTLSGTNQTAFSNNFTTFSDSSTAKANLQVQTGLSSLYGITTSISTNKTSAYSITANDHIIAVDSTSAAITITLPTAVGVSGQEYIIKDASGAAATNNVTVATTSSQTIDGSATKVISTAYGVVRIVSNGSNWLTY